LYIEFACSRHYVRDRSSIAEIAIFLSTLATHFASPDLPRANGPRAISHVMRYKRNYRSRISGGWSANFTLAD
jgi:hypothetical protein